MPVPVLDVSAAVIIHNNTVLLAKRPQGKEFAGYWEFPGGKVEPGETHTDCLKREIMEELGVTIETGSLLTIADHAQTHRIIRLSAFFATITDGHPAAIEHEEIRWCAIPELQNLHLAPADLEIAGILMQHHTRHRSSSRA